MNHHPGTFSGHLSHHKNRHQRSHPSQKGLRSSRKVVEPGMVFSDPLLSHHQNPRSYQAGPLPPAVLASLLLRLKVPLHLKHKSLPFLVSHHSPCYHQNQHRCVWCVCVCVCGVCVHVHADVAYVYHKLGKVRC